MQEILRAPIGIFVHTVPALLQKGDQTFEKFIYIWNIETIRSHLEFQLVLTFSVSLRNRNDQKLSSPFLI